MENNLEKITSDKITNLERELKTVKETFLNEDNAWNILSRNKY